MIFVRAVVRCIATFIVAVAAVSIGVAIAPAAVLGTLLVFALAARYWPLPGLGRVPRAVANITLAGAFLGLIATAGAHKDRADARLDKLAQSDPAAYLEALQGADEERWLRELARLAPEQYAAETARRAEAEAARLARQAEEEAAGRAARAVEKEQALREYTERIQREIDGLANFDAARYSDTKESIIIGVALFNAWAGLIDEGRTYDLDSEQEAVRQRFRERVVEVQTRAFPKLRDAFGPVTRRALWDHDISARTFGRRFTVIEFVGGIFAANRNKREFNEGMWEILNMLRFNQARYKWFRGASEYTYSTIDSPSDRAIVVWGDYGRARIVE